MAQKVEVTLIDDLDGGKADETVTFGLDGVDGGVIHQAHVHGIHQARPVS